MSEIRQLVTETIPSDQTTEAWAVFNKITGEYISVMEKVDLETLNQDFYSYAPIEINLDTQIVKGTYDNFEIVDIQDQPLKFYEKSLDNAAQFKIDKSYGVYKRMEIQEQLLEKISAALNIEDETFLEMRDYIAEVRANNKLYKESLMNDPAYEFVSLQDEALTNENQLEGGIHELIGPRELAPDVLAKPEV